ncbi:NADH-cytochrome b5 reductase-like protein [Carex littledalei]|uniref:NADH-cytochrome b5 reductase-like protein n=1 Tax=Carex littledalei TaxID=544730 RepID=A0A833R1Z6_9POAL|nr:NADH-cytochrome b5 reductase-like protein [Carex littledalei]
MATLLRRLSKSSSLGIPAAFRQHYHSSTQGRGIPVGASFSAVVSGGLALYYFSSSPTIVLFFSYSSLLDITFVNL